MALITETGPAETDKPTSTSGKKSGSAKSVVNDPRMPSARKPYFPPILRPEDTPFDFSSMIAIIFGILGVMLRQRWALWTSVLFTAQALANMRNAETDLKQIVCALTFSAMGIMTIYFAPNQRP